MTTIATVLKDSQLPFSDTSRLDIELLLAAALGKPVSYLHTWPETEIESELLARFTVYLNRRRAGEPIAYILGLQGFWSLELQVSEHTLIPRADTETLVEVCLAHIDKQQPQTILDLGTGTGAVALALASECPLAQVIGVDFIEEAVALAERNRQQLKVTNVAFKQSNWFSRLVEQAFDMIVTNPPYIATHDPHLQAGDVRFEPLTALVSGEDGLRDIKVIIEQAPHHLKNNGWLFLEHGYQQAQAVKDLLKERGFVNIATYNDLGGNERVTGGQTLCS